MTLDEEVKRLIENPLVGEMKVGALKGVRVLKFKRGIVFCSGPSFRA